MGKYFAFQWWCWGIYLASALANGYILTTPPYFAWHKLANLAAVIFALVLWEITARRHQDHLQVMASYAEEERIMQVRAREVYRDMVHRYGEEAAWYRMVTVFGEKEAREIVYGKS